MMLGLSLLPFGAGHRAFQGWLAPLTADGVLLEAELLWHLVSLLLEAELLRRLVSLLLEAELEVAEQMLFSFSSWLLLLTCCWNAAFELELGKSVLALLSQGHRRMPGNQLAPQW